MVHSEGMGVEDDFKRLMWAWWGGCAVLLWEMTQQVWNFEGDVTLSASEKWWR